MAGALCRATFMNTDESRSLPALRIFEQIIDVSESPAELSIAYYNIGEIYRIWGQDALSQSYQSMATDSDAVAKALAQPFRQERIKEQKVSLLEAIVRTEIEMKD